ncbi:MAG: phosphotransferase [Steroidobacterales bacterium]
MFRRLSRSPGRSGRIDVIETHFAWVFLTHALAYKMKKPVRHRGMDYRTLARRERGCRNEIRLNRRLAESTYLGVVPVMRRKDGSLGLGWGLRVVDWVVKMRRLPAARMLDRALASNAVTRRDVEAVTRLLSAFFTHARRAPMSPRAYVARLRSQTLENSRDLHARDLGVSKRRVDEVIRAQLRFIAESATLLGSRGSHLVDGHGDLRPEHVFLGSASDEPCVIDCLEFDRDLRRLDPAEELAFLGLECARVGDRGFAGDVTRNVQLTLDDPVTSPLMHFYMSQRAVIRAKTAVWHLRDPQFAGQSRFWRAAGNSYLADALRYIRLALRELAGRRD